MKVFACAAATLFVLGVATASHAQATHFFEYNFDENGNATFLDPSGSTSQWYTPGTTSGLGLFVFGADPTGSVAGNVLIYKLPELVNSGAVDVAEFGGGISDTLFFTNSSGVNDHLQDADLMVYYSGGDGGGELADSGLPAFAGSLTSVTTEDIAGNFTWLPDGPAFPAGNQYNGISNEAPEPGSLAMALTGAGAALGIFMRRRRIRA